MRAKTKRDEASRACKLGKTLIISTKMSSHASGMHYFHSQLDVGLVDVIMRVATSKHQTHFAKPCCGHCRCSREERLSRKRSRRPTMHNSRRVVKDMRP